MGKASAPAAPDYTPIASADEQSGQLAYSLGEQQLQASKDQMNTVWPYAQQYLQSQINTSDTQDAQAKEDQSYYDSTYKPIESQLANEVQNYGSQGQSDERAGQAMADVSNSYEAQRQSSLSNLESYGIDPSQTRYGALDLSSRVSQAAATAAAGTQSRLNTQATALALQGSEVNTGRGYSNTIAQDYSTATTAGSAGLAGANSTASTGSSIAANAGSAIGAATGAYGGATSALGTGYSDALQTTQLNNQNQASLISGIGQIAGMAGALAL